MLSTNAAMVTKQGKLSWHAQPHLLQLRGLCSAVQRPEVLLLLELPIQNSHQPRRGRQCVLR
jgi:hypothetical protein